MEKLGRFPVVEALVEPRPSVQWPVATLTVTVCMANTLNHDTRVDDPTIQDIELMAAWDAEHHIPARLTADFGAEEAEWYVGVRSVESVKSRKKGRGGSPISRSTGFLRTGCPPT